MDWEANNQYMSDAQPAITKRGAARAALRAAKIICGVVKARAVVEQEALEDKSAAAAAIAGVIGVNPSVVASQNAEGQNPLHYVLSLRHQRHAYGQQLGYANPGELLAVIHQGSTLGLS
jgi:hypothetical protein